MKSREATITRHVVTWDGEVWVRKVQSSRRAKVWPITTGEDKLLVEYEDGTLGSEMVQDMTIEAGEW